MKTVHKTGYIFLGVLILLSYWYIYPTITAAGPSGKIIVSNLTLNLVLVSCLLGGVVPWYVHSRKLSYKYALLGFVVVAVLWFAVLRGIGMSLRW